MYALLTIALVIEWTIRIGAFFIVPKNRKPSSATAWLMLILLVPIIGLLVFLLIGSPKLNKRRRAKQTSMDKAISELLYSEKTRHRYEKYYSMDVSGRYDPIIKLNKNLGGFPAFTGNKTELIDGYYEAIEAIAKDMKRATQYIHIEYFIIVMDDATKVLFDEMKAAVERGVKVRLMYDAIGSRGYPNFKQMKQHLTDIGVEWHPMLPLKLPGKKFNRPDLRNHRKIVVIDGKYGFTGSQNLVTRNYHRKDDLYYDELVVRIQGPVVLQLQAAFVTDWYSETNKMLRRDSNPEQKTEIEIAGDTLAQILPSGPGFDNDNNLKLFTSLIHTAKKSLVIVNPYFVPDDSLMTAITSAVQRNVEVTMINSKIMDQAMVGHAQRSYFEQLLKTGVKIYQYEPPVLLHSKYMTIDNDIAVIGSSNLDMRSFQLDLEVTLIAYDKNVVSKLHNLNIKYLKKSRQIRLAEWKLRSWRLKLFDNLARLTAALQ